MMAGVKGRSGGVRAGSGRKPKPKALPTVIEGDDTLKLLQDIAFGRIPATTIQVRAAIAAVQYTHVKRSDGGKKEEQADKAKRAGGGKFAAAAPPKLVVNNRK